MPPPSGRGPARELFSASHQTIWKRACQGELVAILSPLVSQILEGMYLSKKIEFDAPAPFNDAEAIKVINGVVKSGDIPQGNKPSQYTSAADNDGYALGIMKMEGTKRLNSPGRSFSSAESGTNTLDGPTAGSSRMSFSQRFHAFSGNWAVRSSQNPRLSNQPRCIRYHPPIDTP
jgi:hypothetical protein